MAGTLVYRLRVADPEADHLVKFREAVRGIQSRLDNRSFNHIAGMRGAPNWYCWHHQRNPRTRLQARLFLPWHRAYLYELEQLLQDEVEGAALPWWDWTVDQTVPEAYGRATIDGEDNPLRRYRMVVPRTRNNPAINRNTTRRPGAHRFARLPTPQEFEDITSEPNFESFNDDLESIHDSIHGWMGGDMGDPTTAAYDPIFYAHHCMIDRAWSLWQIAHGNGDFPSEFLDIPLPPFNRTVRDVIDVQSLGYEYAGTATDIDIGESG